MKRILIADDEQAFRELFRDVLEEAEWGKMTSLLALCHPELDSGSY